MNVDDLKTRAGLLLYRQLPEEYRYRDEKKPGELGDLEAYLHGFGHLLDLVRGTTEQAYADSFAEPVDFASDDDGNARQIQPWMLSYLAELVGAELVAPDPDRRTEELNNAVSWFKTKGTLRNVDSIADVVSGAETVLVEGWRRVLTTPRNSLPPFNGPKPLTPSDGTDGRTPEPLGTPDLRFDNRAIADAVGSNPLYRIQSRGRDADGLPVQNPTSFWKARARGGAPCFPGAYDDTAMCTPDLRDPEIPSVGPHPRRSVVHVRPPHGFFETGLREVVLPGGSNPLKFDTSNKKSFQVYGPAEVLRALSAPVDSDGELQSRAPDKLVITGNLSIPSGLRVAFDNVLFMNRVTVAAGDTKLRLHRCAIRDLRFQVLEDTPTVDATDCLFDTVGAPSGFARFIYCTVLGETHIERLWASDCLFAGGLVGVECSGDDSCVRYSAVKELSALAGCEAAQSPSNTDDDPNFTSLWFKDGSKCMRRPAKYGEPGCGVFDLTTATSIREGAEDDGEVGAFHHLYLSAQLRAVRLKLEDFLPLGQEVVIRYDPRLAMPPARVE